jgi:WD40 repeat protein
MASGRFLVQDDKTLKVWDLTTGKEQFTLNGHTSSVNAVAVTADGKRAISGS